MSLVLLTKFHGRRVEISFSVIGDLMGKNLVESTYSAIQLVKYSLNAKTSNTFKPKSVQSFQRLDRIKSSVTS